MLDCIVLCGYGCGCGRGMAYSCRLFQEQARRDYFERKAIEEQARRQMMDELRAMEAARPGIHGLQDEVGFCACTKWGEA